jgi:hypothetical protein
VDDGGHRILQPSRDRSLMHRFDRRVCLKLARETNEIYAKMALIELVTEFRVMAEHRDAQRTDKTRHRLPSHPKRLKLLATDVLRMASRVSGNKP